MRFIVTSLLALGMSGFASANSVTTFQTEVTYDVELVSIRAGAKIVFDEIVSQARRECRSDSSSALLYRFQNVEKTCVADFVDQAVTKINAPELTRVYANSSYAK